MEGGHDYDLAVLYVFLIFTPVLFLLAWGLEALIDTPSKNFAHAVDQFSRLEVPKKKDAVKNREALHDGGEGDDEDDRNCSDFLTSNWILWVHVGFVIAVLMVTEIYGAVDGNKERIEAMGHKHGGGTGGATKM